MTDQEKILNRICDALDRLIAAAGPYDGLFPSMMDPNTGAMLTGLPPAIPGQRNGDRAFQGSNLIHDEAMLLTLRALAEARGEPAYAAAADRYLARFALHCTTTESGLFPWGEHAYWNLAEDRVGNSHALANPSRVDNVTHDHLRQAPLWLWEELYRHSPDCVSRFAEGLDFHWRSGEPAEYCRHAPVNRREHEQRGARSCDFPRHSGFYIFDLAFAYAKDPQPAHLGQIHRFHDYWWDKRDERGLLQIESRSPADDKRFYRTNAPGQTLSLAASLYESAALLDPSQQVLAEAMRTRAGTYTEGFLAAPHDPQKLVFAILCSRDGNKVTGTMPIWGSVYGVWPASYVALTCLCIYRVTGDPRLLHWAAAVGQGYADEPLPADLQVPAMDAGLGLGLLADLYAITGATRWREAGLALAQHLLATFLDTPLPRGASGVDWYESQMGPGFLLHGLARLALLLRDRESCPLSADYTGR